MDAEAYFQWLARHEIDVTDVSTIADLQGLLLAQRLGVNPGFQAALFRTATYENRVFKELGIRPVYVETKLYERLGFGITGKAGFFSWDSLKKLFGLRGAKSEGET